MTQRVHYSLAKISERLGISKASVSLALNGKARKGGLSRELEKQILEFCDKVNYRPNINAQRINSGKARNIGFIIQKNSVIDETSPFCEFNISSAIGGLASAAEEKNYRFTIQVYKTHTSINTITDWFGSREIDGLIFYGFTPPAGDLEKLRSGRFNIAGISITPELGIPCVNSDNQKGARMITEHLIRKGKKEFLYIAGPESSYVAKCRFKGFSEAIEKAGLRLKKENFFMGMFNMDKAKNYVKERFSQGKNGIDAVICANDNMAIGAIGSLLELNISIPDEVSVAGADNIKLGKYIYPSLTTFNYHPYHLGENAFKLLYNIINGSSPGDNILLETSLQARMSA